MQPRRTKTLLGIALLGVAWTMAISFGLGTLLAYESTPGTIGTVPGQWPLTSQIERLTNRPTLVMLVHPRCSCTRASVAELGQLMARIKGKVDAYVLFLKPRQSGSEWEDTELLRSAGRSILINSTSPDERVRKPRGAEDLGRRCCEATEYANPRFLDTLAAAYANQNQFARATETASQAVAHAARLGQATLACEITRRLELYKAGRGYLSFRH